MKKARIIGLILIIGLIGIVLVSAYYDSINKQMTTPIYKGWNLIPIQAQVYSSDTNLKFSDFEYVYAYDLKNKEYVLLYYKGKEVNKEKTINFLDDMRSKGQDYFSFISIWAYSNKEGEIKHSFEGKENLKLYEGWNFIVITPEMKGFSFNEIKGTCNILKMCDYQRQDWDCADGGAGGVDSDSDIGIGMIVKVSDDCTLGTSSGGTTPPELP